MRRYAKFVIPAVVLIGILGILVVNLNASLVYFNTPAEVQARDAGVDRLRLGGRVVVGSVVDEGAQVRFEVEDCETYVDVVHTGVPPQLFQEGIGVVVEGVWTGHEFESDTMLVKHDEQYGSDTDRYDTKQHTCTES